MLKKKIQMIHLIGLILLFTTSINSICNPLSGIKSPLDVFFYYFKNNFSNLNQNSSNVIFELIFHLTTVSNKNFFIFKERISNEIYFHGFQMENTNQGEAFFPKFIKHKNLTVIQIVLGLESHPMNQNNIICSNLRYSMTDYER